MDRRPTITDVARHAGVSKGLVSLALNDRPGVNAATRDRIRSVAADIGWRPNAAARSLTSRRTAALGLVVTRDPSIIETDPFFAAFIAGLETVLSERGQVLVLSVVPDAAAEERTYRTLAGDGRVDGFILTDLRRRDPRIALVEDLGSVAVTLGEPDVTSPFPAVQREYEHGIDELVRYLVGLGHTRIAHVAGNDEMLHGHARREQFERTAASLGVRSRVVPSDFSPEAGAAATEALLALDPADRPTAIVYGNDPMAIAGMSVAQRLGFHVPDDLSISGLDGSQIGRHVHPTLTTLDNDPGEWGRVVAATLLDLIDETVATDRHLRVEATSPGRPVDSVPGDHLGADRTLTPARLIVRGSTGVHLQDPA